MINKADDAIRHFAGDSVPPNADLDTCIDAVARKLVELDALRYTVYQVSVVAQRYSISGNGADVGQ